MKNRMFKLFAFALTVMMLVVFIPNPVSAAEGCPHMNVKFLRYTYEYESASASEHFVNTWATTLCLDCGVTMGGVVSSSVEPHTFGAAVFTGNHYHSRLLHIYETVSTCTGCRYMKYGEVSYPCSGDGTSCPIIKG